MAKNYTYGWVLKDRGCVEVLESEYTENQIDMNNFIESMSAIIKVAKCGWDGVKYKVMLCADNSIEEFMVLYCNNGGSRWIPVSGNNKGCNFSVLGENLW